MSTDNAYLSQTADFARFLRSRGLSAGLKETEDACLILTDTDLSDRETVRLSLRAVFAKSQKEQEVFDRCFDRFFISAEDREKLREKERLEAEEYERRKQEAQRDLTYNGKPMDFSPEYRDVYIRMPEEAKEKLRKYRERFQDSIDRNPELYGSFIHSVFMRSILEQQMLMEDAAYHAEAFDSPELDLLFRDISTFSEAQIRQASALIDRLSREMEAQLKARRKTLGKSYRIDFRRTIRKGLETGGVMFRPVYKKKKPGRKHLVLLLDVSASMLQFSEFALRFIRSLAEISAYSRTFVFSEHAAELQDVTLANEDSFRGLVRSTGLYGRGTNLKESLGELLAARPAVLSSSSFLVILSDGKTVEPEGTAALLSSARHMAGDVLFLNPIPERRWSRLQSVTMLSAAVRMLPCSTLDELSRAVRHLVKV